MFTSEFLRLRKMLTNLSAKQLPKQKRNLKNKLLGIVIDVRNNPGGLLDQAVDVSDLFLEKGEIVSTRSRNEADTVKYMANEGDIAKGLPIVVIINEGSASASEILAGALQDHHRAIILGEKSFGKGSVQTVIPLRGLWGDAPDNSQILYAVRAFYSGERH